MTSGTLPKCSTEAPDSEGVLQASKCRELPGKRYGRAQAGWADSPDCLLPATKGKGDMPLGAFLAQRLFLPLGEQVYCFLSFHSTDLY